MSEAGDCCVMPESGMKNSEVDQNGNKMADAIEAGEEIAEGSGETMPALEITNFVDESTSRSSTPSDGNTPRDCDTSSGSPSPVPDDSTETQRRRINLGRDISLMMQALNSLHSPEEKIAALCKKYADLLEQQKMKDKRLRGMERKVGQGTKEKEQLQKELNKALLGKSKMESLARELNKQNKLLKEESYNLSMTHKQEREQVSAKFQAATDEISGKINAIADRNDALNEQNREMTEKMNKLIEETREREKMMKKMLEQRDIQERILELQVKKAEEERDLALEGQEHLKKEVEKTTALCEGYMKQEKHLKGQITYYSDKVTDFQSTLDKSNKVFTTFRQEMDAMNGRMKELEKSTATWKKNYEICETKNKRLLSETVEQVKQINQLDIKVTKLTNLSRALQAERNDLAQQVKVAKQKSDTVTAEATSTVNDNGTLQPIDEVRGQPQGRESPDSSSEPTTVNVTSSSQSMNPDELLDCDQSGQDSVTHNDTPPSDAPMSSEPEPRRLSEADSTSNDE